MLTSSDATIFPASKIQEHFWVLNQLKKDNAAYHITSVFKLSGKLDINCLKKALSLVIANHESLRTNFVYQQYRLFQVVHNSNDIDFQYFNITNGNLTNEISKELHRSFHVEHDHLLRIRLYQTEKFEFWLTLVFHHSIIDLHSKDIFANELSDTYNNLLNGLETENINAPKYSEFSEKHHSWINSNPCQTLLNEWADKLKNQNLTLNLPSDNKNKSGENKGSRIYFELTEEEVNLINTFAAQNSFNSFVILLSAYFVFLNRICNQGTVSVGVPFTNRRDETFQNTIGCFVNILPVTVEFSDEITFSEVLKKVRLALLQIHRKQEIPFLMLHSAVGKEKALFQTGFTFEHPMDLSFQDVQVENIRFDKQGAQLDLFMTLWEEKNKFCGHLEYANMLSTDFAQRLTDIYGKCVISLLKHPDQKVSQVNILPAYDQHFIFSLNDTACAYEHDICIHEKLEKQAFENPFATALIFNGEVINYNTLNKLSNSVANFLISKGIKTEDKIAVCTYRSFEMMISIFGILKAGAAYVPVNPNDPEGRITSIITDAAPKFIMTTKSSSTNLQKYDNLIYTDDILTTPLSCNFHNPDVDVTSRNLAYILYTSGSTGVPKGVMIEHHSVLNRLLWMQKKYPLFPEDTLLQKTPITFDVSVWELFWWSFAGAKLCILPPDGEKDPELIIKTIEEHSVTAIHFVPSMFNFFIGALKISNSRKIESLKRIFLSGEALPAKMVNDFHKHVNNPSIELINLYGPTEATVDVSYYDCPASETDTIYIGKPIDNTKLIVINQAGGLQPLEVTGELAITGVNLSRGYLNRPELNESKFFQLELPWGNKERAYRTGDLVKLCTNGELEYLGRIDNQVKIRGFRIELGEIESRILDYPGIISCVVLTDGEEEKKHLIAYICKQSKEPVDEKSLKDFLRHRLPEYMIPAFIVVMDCFQLTSNGKIDRKALPKPQKESVSNTFVPAVSQTEKLILQTWESILDMKNLSINANFFDVGGNSLLAIKLCAKLNEDLKNAINPTDIFQYPTIRDFSLHLGNVTEEQLHQDSRMEDRILKRRQFLKSRAEYKNLES